MASRQSSVKPIALTTSTKASIVLISVDCIVALYGILYSYHTLGQGRLDGAFCGYKEADKMNWLNLLKQKGVMNIEMESSMFSALTNYAGIKASIICVAILNRLNGDQVRL